MVAVTVSYPGKPSRAIKSEDLFSASLVVFVILDFFLAAVPQNLLSVDCPSLLMIQKKSPRKNIKLKTPKVAFARSEERERESVRRKILLSWKL